LVGFPIGAVTTILPDLYTLARWEEDVYCLTGLEEPTIGHTGAKLFKAGVEWVNIVAAVVKVCEIARADLHIPLGVLVSLDLVEILDEGFCGFSPTCIIENKVLSAKMD
jgi:hypothetical protein